MAMVKQMINGTFRQTNLPNEREEYLSKREELRLAEIELRNQRERVAELRRKLPQGPAVQDYAFEEVAAGLELRLLSAGSSTFKYDLSSEDKEGNQDSTISVFTRDSDGTVRHFYTGHPWLSSDIKERGIDELVPIWNMLDLTRQGRGDFYAKLEYPQAAA